MNTTYLLRLLVAACLVSLASVAAHAQSTKAIYTGGTSGAYHNLFCPPIVPILDNAYFKGYQCASSSGTLDNMKRVVANPRGIGFAQLDVFTREQAAHPDQFGKLTPVRQLACEGLWMVTKNPDIQDYGKVLGYARRIQFVLPPKDSGSAASFAFLQSLDPSGLGRATNVRYAASVTQMLDQVAAGREGEVGFFVQFADPSNANIKAILDKGLHVVPVVSREIMAAKNGDKEVYQVQEFNLSEGGFFVKGKTATTACTPTVIFTTKPDAMTDKNGQDDQRDMIQKIGEVPDSQFLPHQSTIAAIIKGTKRIGGAALNEMMAATDAARKKVEEMSR